MTILIGIRTSGSITVRGIPTPMRLRRSPPQVRTIRTSSRHLPTGTTAPIRARIILMSGSALQHGAGSSRYQRADAANSALLQVAVCMAQSASGTTPTGFVRGMFVVSNRTRHAATLGGFGRSTASDDLRAHRTTDRRRRRGLRGMAQPEPLRSPETAESPRRQTRSPALSKTDFTGKRSKPTTPSMNTFRIERQREQCNDQKKRYRLKEKSLGQRIVFP